VLPPGIVKFQDAEHEAGSGIVEWTAPDMNWNPWINQPMIIEGAEEYQVSVPLTETNISGCSFLLLLVFTVHVTHAVMSCHICFECIRKKINEYTSITS